MTIEDLTLDIEKSKRKGICIDKFFSYKILDDLDYMYCRQCNDYGKYSVRGCYKPISEYENQFILKVLEK